MLTNRALIHVFAQDWGAIPDRHVHNLSIYYLTPTGEETGTFRGRVSLLKIARARIEKENCKLLINHEINTKLSTTRGKEQIVDNER